MKYKCGGYVGYDTRKKDENFGYPIRTSVEVETVVDLPRGATPDDCGAGTAAVVKALEEIVKKRFKVDRHVECNESWEVTR